MTLLFADSDAPNLYTVLLALIAGLPALIAAWRGISVSKGNAEKLTSVENKADAAKTEATAAKYAAKETQNKIENVQETASSIARTVEAPNPPPIRTAADEENGKGI